MMHGFKQPNRRQWESKVDVPAFCNGIGAFAGSLAEACGSRASVGKAVDRYGPDGEGLTISNFDKGKRSLGGSA